MLKKFFCYNDSLNINIKKLSLNLLNNINNNSYVGKTIKFFTLSELIKLSKNEKNSEKIVKKTNQNKITLSIHDLVAKNNADTENINAICNTYSISKNFTNQFKIILKDRKSNDDYEHGSSKICANLYRNNNCLLLGGTNKRKRKRLNYAKLDSVGFDISNVPKISEQSLRKDAKLRANKQTKYMFNCKEDIKKLDENRKQMSLSNILS